MRGERRYQETSYKDTATAQMRSKVGLARVVVVGVERSRRVQWIDT